MRLFIDSVTPEKWNPFSKAGIIYGVTTNPLIFKKEGRPYRMPDKHHLVQVAREQGLKELQIQITGIDSPQEAVKEFMEVFERWPEGVVAKVPFGNHWQTLKILGELDSSVPVTFTTGYSIKQAVIAKAKGARYIAPYFGRLLDAKEKADAIIDDMLKICDPETRVLVASIRTADQVIALATRGHNCFTLSPNILEELMVNEASILATDEFEVTAGKR